MRSPVPLIASRNTKGVCVSEFIDAKVLAAQARDPECVRRNASACEAYADSAVMAFYTVETAGRVCASYYQEMAGVVCQLPADVAKSGGMQYAGSARTECCILFISFFGRSTVCARSFPSCGLAWVIPEWGLHRFIRMPWAGEERTLARRAWNRLDRFLGVNNNKD